MTALEGLKEGELVQPQPNYTISTEGELVQPQPNYTISTNGMCCSSTGIWSLLIVMNRLCDDARSSSEEPQKYV